MSPDETRTRHERVGELFLAAARLPEGERTTFLEQACGPDGALRSEVESLLAQDSRDLDARAGAAIVREAHALGADDGATLPASIGGYRILRRIGAGGMGVVYEAEQSHPSRRVALKVIRPGFASESTLRRFRHEAQVLGWLDHPGIARVYEAGTEDDGHGPQPWFAMELVVGQPLDRWVAERRLDLRARLSLLAQVCDAVHHAHQKGVIHRDLKPANVLVDAQGRPRVLDFGVARVTDHDLAASTLRTLEGELIGTLPYMSPEQIEADPSKLDVRSDVYALGVVAYELLSGRLPHDLEAKRIAAAARAIVEDEPSTLGSLDPGLRGDVETIVAKAIEKDITRRYASAEELASDIRRHLSDEPIQARPPSALYQLGKFARRNRALVGGVVALFVVLVVATAVSWKLMLDARDAQAVAEAATGQANSAREDERRQRQEAERNLVRAEKAETDARVNAGVALAEADAARTMNDFLLSLFLEADPMRSREDITLRDLLDRAAVSIAVKFADRPRQHADLAGVIGLTYDSLGEFERARPLLEESLRLTREDPVASQEFLGTALARLGSVQLDLGNIQEARSLFEEALELGFEPKGTEADILIHAMRGLAQALVEAGDAVRGEQLARRTLALARANPSIPTRFEFLTRQVLAAAIRHQGRNEEAMDELLSLRDLLAELGEAHGRDMAYLYTSIADLALRMNDLEGAEAAFREGRAIGEQVDDPNMPPAWIFSAGLGRVSLARGDVEAAAGAFEQAVAAKRATGLARHPYMITSLSLLADARNAQGRPAEALDALSEALEVLEQVLGPEHPNRDRILRQVVTSMQLGLDQATFEPALDRFRDAMDARGHAGECEQLELLARG